MMGTEDAPNMQSFMTK